MKRLIISMSILFLLVSFSLVPTLAEESDTAKTDYVAELNKLGIAGRPESDNAAPYYQKAIELYVKQPEGLKVSTKSWPKELPVQEQALLKKWVQDNNRALEQLQLGSQKTYCWFKHTGQTLQQTEMPHLRTERQLAYALQARAMLQAEDGNITGAVDDIVTLYTFGAHIADGPKLLVAKLVGIAIKTLPIRTAFNILDKKMVDANLMKRLEDGFKQFVTDYNEPFDIRSEKLSLQEQVETDPKLRFFKPYLNSTLEYYDTIAAKNTWQLHNEKTKSITEDNPLIETAGSGIPSVIEIEYRTRADEQALITTLAVLRYNAEGDGYPGALPQLVSAGYLKELPIDPFSNKPLVYKQTRQGFTLYSFGADFDDDGGLHSKWGSGEEDGDQVFWPLESTSRAQTQVAEQRILTRPEERPRALSQRTNEKVQYKLKLEGGQKYYYQTSRNGEFFDRSMYQQRPTMLQTIETGAEIAVNDIDSNGNMWATYTYRWLNIRIISQTHNIVYDSSKKAMPRSPVEQGYAALLGESFSLKITPEGRVAEIKGLDKMRSNVRNKLPPGPMQASTIENLNQYLNEEDVKHEIEESLAIYPEKPVGIGDSWGREFVSSGEFAMILSNIWTLKERKNGVAVIEVVSTIKPNLEAKPSKVGNERVSFRFSGKQQGVIEIQESTGLKIRSEVNQQMSGKITTARQGVPDKVTAMKIVGVITMSMNEWEKAKSIVGTNAVAEEQPRRETPYSRTERPQRRGLTDVISPARPYLTDDDEEYLPARPRAGQETTSRSLHQAVVNGDIDQVNLLISKGADVNVRNRMNWTPLHTAIQNRRQAIVELLVTKGADINAKDNRGQTPLHVAVNLGQKEVVELLIAKGADVNVMGSRGDNALSLAKKRQNTEIIDLLLKHGAKEPSSEDLMGDRYYEGENPYQDYGGQQIQRGTRAIRPVVQSPAQINILDILADPNEIRGRIKTFEGLEKALKDVADKSQSEMRYWQQKRHDNRTLLLRSVEKQFEDELGFIRKAAAEEEAKKTTETINSVLSTRQERFQTVRKELLTQKRELRQMQPSRGRRGRTRTSGRSTRGRSSQRRQPYGEDMTDSPYGRGEVMPGTNRYQSPRGPTEQIDRETENEIRQWLQADIENKTDLAKAVHEQLRVEISYVRSVAVEEEAKKTTAAIDGVLLYRQTRFEEFFKKMEEEQQALRQQTQDPRIRGRGRYPQDGQMQQQNQPRTRGRRR